jgi:hypothetical protein
MRRTKADKRSREGGDDGRVSSLLHDGVYEWDRKRAKHCRKSTHANERDVVVRVRVTDVFKVELAVKADEPSSKSEEHLGERGMDVEVILALDVLGSKFTEMHFIEAGGNRSDIGKSAVDEHTYTTSSGLLIL